MPKLTQRQLDILRFLSQGYVIKEIGSKLAVSRKTVEFHKYRIMKFLGVKTTAEVVRFTIQAGLL